MSLKLHFEEIGNDNAPAVIILHGLFGSSSNWRSIARTLSRSWHVFSLDLRNHGKSPWHDEMQYQDMAGDVTGFIAAKAIDSPILIGHSMGGKTAMTLAQMSLLPLGKIFVVDIAPVPYRHNHDTLVEAMWSVNFTVQNSRSKVDQQLSKFIDEAPLRQFLMQNLERRDGKLAWRLNLSAIVNNMSCLLGYDADNLVDHEMIFIAGTESDYLREKHHATVKSLFPNAVMECINGAGHWLHAEQPGELVRIIHHHLSE